MILSLWSWRIFFHIILNFAFSFLSKDHWGLKTNLHWKLWLKMISNSQNPSNWRISPNTIESCQLILISGFQRSMKNWNMWAGKNHVQLLICRSTGPRIDIQISYPMIIQGDLLRGIDSCLTVALKAVRQLLTTVLVTIFLYFDFYNFSIFTNNFGHIWFTIQNFFWRKLYMYKKNIISLIKLQP